MFFHQFWRGPKKKNSKTNNAKKTKEGDIPKSREKFKNKKNKNLIFLLEDRFFWMKKFIGNKKNIIELGSGNGASKEILKNENIIFFEMIKLVGRSSPVSYSAHRAQSR